MVDLSRRTVSVSLLDRADLRKYVGGRGLAAKLFYDLAEPGADPLGPRNPLIFLTGPLTGTPTPGAGKFIVVTKSPLTGAWLESYSSGALAWQLKQAGFDGLVVTGAADRPVYLVIRDGRGEIRDASAVWGSDCFETEDRIRQLEGDSELAVSCIGPAGENLVPFACITSDRWRQAGRGGTGTVMGSKRLKAVCAHGTLGIEVDDPAGLFRLLADRVAAARENPRIQRRQGVGTSGTMLVTNSVGLLPVRNFKETSSEKAKGTLDADGMRGAVIHARGCYSCIAPCGTVTTFELDGRTAYLEGPEYETLGLLGSNLEIYDLPTVIKANDLCDRLGLDTISTGNVIGFAMECAEKGLLPPAAFPAGFPRFGDGEAALALISDIAWRRRGAGELLALGTREMARAVGGEAERFAMQVKGLELPAYDPRATLGGALAYAVAPRGGCHRRSSPVHTLVQGQDWQTPEGKAQVVKGLFDSRGAQHCLVICDFIGRGVPVTLGHYAAFLTAVTGEPWDEAELVRVTERTETLIRLINGREGFGRKDDTLPWRLLNEPVPSGPAAGCRVTAADLDIMLSDYYALRGWDEDGVPTAETIRELRIP